ncbi:type II toxin-antitoxin system YafO family toxin [Pseudomonas sp.]|uniref:type II toxin-antitoxin system YafO family toxin n=1 Tax=Pseudomonas sp. TaxID=306 RepID=UPI002611EEFB|nr:type II toxin-antitoxin system YafO family toxin [Pseudomonas sp.]
MRDDLPDYFGFDVEYGSPPAIAGCIEHIHLCIPPRNFPKRQKQAQRKCRKGEPENDVALVYARGLFENNQFCIIGVLMPDAHEQANNNDLMLYLGRLGREFRSDN